MDIATTIDQIAELPEPVLRGKMFSIGGVGPEPGHLYPHQVEALRRIELVSDHKPPVSGILHFPTGAGKTRVGVELMARALTVEPSHCFIWATARKMLIRQSMVRMAELSALFPRSTSLKWCRNADDVDTDVRVSFMTQRALSRAFEQAADGRRTRHPWRRQLESGRALTLIYDECHQLGAEGLQDSWSAFHEALVTSSGGSRSWRAIGLSATPLPTSREAQDFLSTVVFPKRNVGTPVAQDWPFHVFHRVTLETLIESGVLCGINGALDSSGLFDLPAHLLSQVIGDAQVHPPGDGATGRALQEYALQFNSRVMADPRVVQFLSDRLGQNASQLGKTIVFVPNIESANRLAAQLYEAFPALRGRIAAVHSKMEQLRVPGQEKATVHEVLDQFRRLGGGPSFLINVQMLTEGFDDPKIESVVLARLTLSTNLFWQMIGRGTRGPSAGGTTECKVIDPVKLCRLYDYFSGYQPNLTSSNNVEFEDDDSDVTDESFRLPVAELPPDPARVPIEVDPELERVHGQVAKALREFLQGRGLSENDAVAVSRGATIQYDQTPPVFRPSDDTFQSVTAQTLLLGEISQLEARAGVDLSWFRRQSMTQLDDTLLRYRLRLLRFIEGRRAWTESEFARAQMSPEFARALQEAAPAVAQPGSGAVVFTEVEAAVVDTMILAARSDGELSGGELVVALDTLRRLFGRAATEEVSKAVASREPPPELSFVLLRSALDDGQRQRLFVQLAELVAADGVIKVAEAKRLRDIGDKLGLAGEFVAAVTDAHPVSEAGGTLKMPLLCGACRFEVPGGAAYCPGCGSKLP